MNHESLSIPEDSEVWCELEERQYQKFKARFLRELGVTDEFGFAVVNMADRRLHIAQINQGRSGY